MRAGQEGVVKQGHQNDCGPVLQARQETWYQVQRQVHSEPVRVAGQRPNWQIHRDPQRLSKEGQTENLSD